MPYSTEFASKTGHQSLANNAEVASFLEDCSYLAPLTEEKAKGLAAMFQPVTAVEKTIIDHVHAIDGSRCEIALHERLPNTSIGFVQVNKVHFSLADYRSLAGNRTIDPFAFSRLQKGCESLQFCAPGSNVLWKNYDTVKASFRAALDQFLGKSGLRDTLFHLASSRPGPLQTPNPSSLLLHKCPSDNEDDPCKQTNLVIHNSLGPQQCPACGTRVFASDVLRIHEEVQEHGSIEGVLTRTSLALEHLGLIHQLRLQEVSAANDLAKSVYFVDGPLAIFGPPCSLHASIQKHLHELQKRIPTLLIVGIQKTGHLVDHAKQLASHLQPGTLLAVTDHYRYSHVIFSRDAAERTYGRQAYYGQDFIYFTRNKNLIVFGLPYCTPAKGGKFAVEKSDPANYPQLPMVCSLLKELGTELYADALVPTVLAHRSASISQKPGAGLLRQLGTKHLTQP